MDNLFQDNQFQDEWAAELTAALFDGDHRIVFAESCTAGLISASLARIPGVSTVLAGSAVTYQIATKTRWLDVHSDTIHQHDVVSQPVSYEMATGVLAMTPQATISASVTGHLGPDAPAELDGVAWTTVCQRGADGTLSASRQLQLITRPGDGLAQRRARQRDAVRQVLAFTLECLQQPKLLSQ